VTLNKLLGLAALVLGIVAAILAALGHGDALKTAVILCGAGTACAGAAIVV
jgi:hypothetical protein